MNDPDMRLVSTLSKDQIEVIVRVTLTINQARWSKTGTLIRPEEAQRIARDVIAIAQLSEWMSRRHEIGIAQFAEQAQQRLSGGDPLVQFFEGLIEKLEPYETTYDHNNDGVMCVIQCLREKIQELQLLRGSAP
jgi:hypothetical protein